MDTSRPFFQVRQGERFGDRLLWRFPFRSTEIRRRMLPVLRALGPSEPSQITIGYYFQLDDPDGAWAFMPLNTPLAVAALGIEMVQRRICTDLADRAGSEDGR